MYLWMDAQMKHSPLDHYDIKWENVWSRASGMNERDEK